jgi:hypothetical protein
MDMDENVSRETNKQKTLANCTTIEFLRQANKIRKAVGNYYDECDFKSILGRKPDFPFNSTVEQKEEIASKFRREQIDEILDICLDANAEKTVEIIGLMCFMTKEEAESTKANILLGLALELISSQEVVDFFSKMVQSGMIGMVNSSQASTSNELSSGEKSTSLSTS